jgi:uncharacterized protein (DUF2141 family)
MNRLVAIFFTSFLIFSCAKIVTPNGGPKDNQPPVFVNSKPYQNSINFKGNEIEIKFNEYIVLENPNTNVLISPQIKPNPEITSNLKSIHIKGLDSLKENTTYVIDFANAIKDNNEGNRLNGFSFAFSTSDHIDTLWYEGKVLDAFELTAIPNKYVLLYSNFDTTYIKKNPSDYLTKTDSNGVFRFHNLANGEYKLFILDDKNQNKIYDLANEGIGFSNEILKPYLPDSTAKTRLQKQKFYYTAFVEEKTENLQNPSKQEKKDTLFHINKYEKDTLDFFKGRYDLVFKDTLSTDSFPALLIKDSDTTEVNFTKTNDTIYSFISNLDVAKQYEIIIKANSISNIYNQKNKEYKHKFYNSSPEYYGSLTLNIKDSISNNACYICYLYNMAGKIVLEEQIPKNTNAITFKYLKEGTYKAKIAIDQNCNKQWDKANFNTLEENEKVFIYNKNIVIKKTWTTEEDWIISK